MTDFRYKKIILTGAGSGIGRALLNQLADYEAQIVAVDIDGEQLATAVKMVKPSRANLRPFVADVGRPENIDELFRYTLQMMNGVDLFIANAGFAYYEQVQEPDWERIEQIYRVNVFSPIYAAIKMKAINGNQPYKVVITASAMGRMALPGYAIYASTKAALHRFAEGYRLELEEPEQLVLVYPIATQTNFFDAAATRRIPVPWPSQAPEQVAHAIITGINQNRIAIYPSRLFAIYLFVERFIPFLRSLIQAREKQQFEQWLADYHK